MGKYPEVARGNMASAEMRGRESRVAARGYNEKDLPTIRKLELAAENFGEQFLEWEMILMKRDSIPEFGAVFVAENKGEIVGYIALSKRIFSIQVDSLVVREDMRRKGVGTVLIEKAKEYTRDSNLSILRVDTGDFMNYAINFYLKAGFRPCGYVTHDFGPMSQQLHFYMDISGKPPQR
jgi:GNAT superfamily N-acetyltransferase